MSNFIPHDQYQDNIKRQVERIEKTNWRYNYVMSCTIFGITGFLVLAIFVFEMVRIEGAVDSLPWLTQVIYKAGTEFLGEEFGPIIFLFFLVIGTFSLILLYVKPERFRETKLACPHCANDISLEPPYKCGWCGKDNEAKPNLTAPRIGLRKCKSCRKTPIALMCPTCNNDIVLDLDAYNSANQLDYGYEGTLTQLIAPPRLKL